MRVLLIGGFLGSGKTTMVLKLIDRLAADGKKIALIINELGEVGIDDATLEKIGISSKELTNGCICCTLAANLRVTVSEIVKIRDPDILIIEPPGLALAYQVRDELLAIDVTMSFAPLVTLIDASRFEGISHIPNFTDHQYNEAEIIGINKADLVDEEKIKSIETFLKKKNPDVYTVRMSATGDDAVIDKIYDMLMRKGEKTVSRIDMSAGQKPVVTEKANSIEVSNVTAYLGRYSVSGELTVKSVGTLLENIVGVVGMEISKVNRYSVGHVKMTVKVDETLVKVSQRTGGSKAETEYITSEKAEGGSSYELCILAAATNVKEDDIAKIVDQTMKFFLEAKKLTFEKQTFIA